MKNKLIDRPINNPQFQTLRWRLLISYLGVMVAILGTSTLAIYEFFATSLYQKVDRQLVNLADAAAHNLPIIKADRDNIKRKLHETIDNDGDLDIPWQDMRQSNQSIEWFDVDRQLLGRAGKHFAEFPLTTTNFQAFQQDDIRTLTIPVYVSKLNDNKETQGYVRVSESTEDIEEELERLYLGLSLGWIIALTLTGIGGWWLTKQSLQPIENSFQQLKQFTADASHELRSPLTAIKTCVEVMQSHPDRIHPADINKLQAIASATNQMTGLVADLLFLARNDAQPIINLELISIPLDELLEDLIDFLQPQAEEKGIIFQSYLQAGILVKGDGNQLRRLFANLLENAVQYTPKEGKISIIMNKFDRFAIVNVEDTGIGIAPEELKFVFDRFWRADKARLRRHGGSGLGLAIAQSIAQLHRGDIFVTSQLGVGTSFRVRLPISS